MADVTINPPKTGADNRNTQTSSSNKNATPKKPNGEQSQKPTGTSTPSKGSTSEFLCKVRYLNNLPDLPFDPKFLSYPFDDLRFVRYQTTSLEKNYKNAFHTEQDLGIPIDLIDPKSYKSSERSQHDPLPESDKKLVEPLDTIEESAGGASSASNKKRDFVRPSVFWLQKTKYMTTESDLPVRRTENIESRTGWGNKRDVASKEKEMKREDQIRAIQATFDKVKQPVHPSNPSLKPIDVLPIFPDFERWPNIYTQVVFDTDPINSISHSEITQQEREQLKNESIIKGFGVEGSKTIVAYLVPKKRKHEEGESDSTVTANNVKETEYDWVREYTYDVKTGRDFADTYFFSVTPDCIYFNEVGTRVSLTKYKDMTWSTSFLQPSKVTAVHRELTKEEAEKREERRNEIEQNELVSGHKKKRTSSNQDEIQDEEDSSVWEIDEEDKNE